MFQSLKTRIEIYTVLSVLFTSAILIAVFSYQLNQDKLQLLKALSSKQSVVSKAVIDKSILQMEKKAFAFTLDKALFEAV
ncbi:MAG TPA: hypothetical protein ENK73_00565, partial [Thiomicrospira sp.]|jgi:hypothetical protein|nr:hypothetical protein [Thiomicrospira sp.]